ncbi:MAG: TetR/AcrR family transcriptional regulator [Rhodococcus sp. (in: high G+C Gram-positive bacteria)]|uniref:TetR/AcrR family transcriptional regulator n=1 Tax=Rhodococcus sp. TaxID=1831 RepID=UPI003BB1BE66
MPAESGGTVAVRDEILEATARLMLAHSFGELSVAQILKEAGISRATFYSYFGSKFSVLSGLLARAMDDMFETVQPFLVRAEGDDPEVALERSMRAVTGMWHRHRLVLQATNHHWHSEPELRTLWLQIVDRFVDAGAAEIEREREAGLVRAQTPSRQLAAVLFWGTERVLHVAGLGVEREFEDEESVVTPLVEMWRGTLYGR